MAGNKGYDAEVIADYFRRMEALGKNFILSSEDEMTDEMAHFTFIERMMGSL